MLLGGDQMVETLALSQHVPRRLVVPLEPADAQSLALAECVVAEPRMLADLESFAVDDWAWVGLDVALEKIPKATLADETNAGRVLFAVVLETMVAGDLTHA